MSEAPSKQDRLLEKWSVFICYRQTDGKEAAQWLYEKLQGSTLPVTAEVGVQAKHLEVYFDQTAPAVEDWTKVHQPALQRAKAFLMVCSPGAKHKLDQDDWVYRELEWWLEHRNTAPIVIDSTGEGERWIPNELLKRWPKAQQVVVCPREWETFPEREREKEQRNAVTRIVEGIYSSERHVHYEDLDREKKRSRELRRLSIGLLILVLLAAALAAFGWWQKEEALVARDAARDAELQAKNQAELAHRQLSRFLASDAERLIAERPVLAGLLAVEAARIGHSAATDDPLRNVLRTVNGRSLRGQEGGISSVALSADGQTLASGGRDKSVLVWDLTQPEAGPRVLRRHEDFVRSVALSADGQTLVSASYNEIIVWDLTQSEPKARNLDGSASLWTQGAKSVALSADGKFLVSGPLSFAVAVVWDLSQPEVEPRVLRNLHSAVSGVAVSADGRTVVVRTYTGLRVWDLTQTEAKPMVLSTNWSSGVVALSSDGQTLVSASEDHLVVWDLTQPDPKARTVGSGATSLALSADGRTLVSGSKDHKVRVWDLPRSEFEPRVLRVLNGHETSVTSVALSADGRTAVSGGEDRTVRVWDLTQPEVVLSGQHVALSADGRILVYNRGDDVVVSDLSEPEAEAQVLGEHKGGVFEVAVSADGRAAVSGGEDSTVRVWDLARPEAERHEYHGVWVWGLSLSSDGQTLGMVDGSTDEVQILDLTMEGSEPRILDLDEASAERCIECGPGSVMGVALSADGQIVVSGSEEGKVWMWDRRLSEIEAQVLGRHESSVQSVAVSADGQTVVSGSFDQTVRVWNLSQSEVEAQVLGGHDGTVSSVAVSADGQTVVSGSTDQTVRVWDLSQSEVEAQLLGGHDGTVSSVAVSADGQTLVSGSSDQRVRIWRLDFPEIEELIPRVCRWVGRNLTPDEWEHYFPAAQHRATCPQLSL